MDKDRKIDITPLKPHPSVFEAQKEDSSLVRVAREAQYVHQLDHISYPKTKGIMTWDVGAKFPTKGLQYPEALDACNIAKRNTMFAVKTFAGKEMFFLALLPWKWKMNVLRRFLEEYERANHYILSPHFIQKRFYCGATRGVRQLIYLFLKELGITKFLCSSVSKIFAHLIEYDYPYRYYLQDFFTLINKKWLLENPSKELKRVMEIAWSRHKKEGLGKRFQVFITLLTIGFYHSKVKRAFLRTIQLTDIDIIKFDEIDIHSVLTYAVNYDFMGTSDNLRKKIYWDLYEGKPPMGLKLTWKK